MGLGTILVVIGEIIDLLEDEDDSCNYLFAYRGRFVFTQIALFMST